jgi:hypothetical protein
MHQNHKILHNAALMETPPNEDPRYNNPNGFGSSSSTKKMPRLGQSIHKYLNNLMLPKQPSRSFPFVSNGSANNSGNKFNPNHIL